MSKISVYLIAFNEAEKVGAALQSVQWADEIVLVDSHSTDGTLEIARQLGARVVQVAFKGFGDLRNRGIDACSHDWIFSLDADERCTPEAQAEILSIVRGGDTRSSPGASAEEAPDCYWVPRRNFFMGRWIRYSGWYPNYRQPQLFRKGSMSYDQKEVHENYILHTSKSIGYLRHAIWQFPFKNLSEVMQKANRYSSLGAQRLVGKASMGSALTHAAWAFIKHYVFKRGFLDGWPGFVIALGNFEGTFYRYAKAFEAQNADQWKTAGD